VEHRTPQAHTLKNSNLNFQVINTALNLSAFVRMGFKPSGERNVYEFSST
jgi:hypothetical protein